MTTLAIITALVIGGALCMLVGYAFGATRGEYDGARRERLTAEVLRSQPPLWTVTYRPGEAPTVATSPSAVARWAGGAAAVSGAAVAIVEPESEP